MDVEPTAEPSEETDSVRITRQGKLRVWVKKALDFFENQPDRPLVLYAAPADVSTSTIARLISVVEIVKREYLKGRDVSTGDVSGLHQYNQLSSALHMKVTLSVKPIAGRCEKRETYQAPAIRRMSKAAKARMRKRLKKQSESV